MHHKHTLRAMLLLIMLLSACTPAATVSTPVPATPVATLVVRQPAPADTLRWSLEGISDMAVIDPAQPGGLPNVTVIGMVFNGLVRLDEKMEIEPDGASDWQVSGDGRIYTFTIRAGLTFADGTPVTAADWVYSINRALAPETASFGAPAQLSHIIGAKAVSEGTAREASGVRALDERHLEITLDAPLAYFLAQLVYPYTFVVPRSLVESGPDWATRAYGTGPFTIQAVVPGDSISLVRNERYWRGMPDIPKLRFVFNPDSEAAYRRYQAGELDIMGSWQTPVPAASVAEASSLPDFQSAAILATRYIGFNHTLDPLKRNALRRALALAIDKQALVDGPLHGNGIAATRILPTGLLGTQYPIQPLSFNPETARNALAEAGFPDGQRMPALTLTYAVEGDNASVTAMLRDMWKQNLGIDVTLEPLDLDSFSKRLDATYRTPATGLQMYYSVWGADYPDPHNFLSQQLESGTANNNGHFSNPEFDRLVQEADQLGDRTQIERRLQLYSQAEQIAIDQVGWLPLFYPEFNILVNPRVQGLVITPNGLVANDWSMVTLGQ